MLKESLPSSGIDAGVHLLVLHLLGGEHGLVVHDAPEHQHEGADDSYCVYNGLDSSSLCVIILSQHWPHQLFEIISQLILYDGHDDRHHEKGKHLEIIQISLMLKHHKKKSRGHKRMVCVHSFATPYIILPQFCKSIYNLATSTITQSENIAFDSYIKKV